jgi:hypothetical protein
VVSFLKIIRHFPLQQVAADQLLTQNFTKIFHVNGRRKQSEREMREECSFIK